MQPLWKTVKKLNIELKKLNIELPYHPAILLLGIFLRKTKTLIWTLLCFTAALFIIAKIWKQTKCSMIDEWVKKI